MTVYHHYLKSMKLLGKIYVYMFINMFLTAPKPQEFCKVIRQALAAWFSGHRVRLQNRGSRVQVPPGCKVFMNLYIAVLLS
jgi:hypothetical protein